MRVGVTDWDWYEHLRAAGATEVNFWQPSGGRRFGALSEGDPFFFKTHYSHGNRLVGAGFYSGWATLPLSIAWGLFGEANGCTTLAEMRDRIAKYRRLPVVETEDPEVGCIMLDGVRFFGPDHAPPAPSDWAPNIVQGRTYEEGAQAEYLLSVLGQLLESPAGGPGVGRADLQWPLPVQVPGPVLDGERRVAVRVGQRAFKALVQEAYGRRCAVTGDKIVPVLEAAHIRPVALEGENRLDNGLLLRSDVHTLFDLGYVGVHPERRTLMVSPRLRRQWGNGEEFYAIERSSRQIQEPERRIDRPNKEFLEWHADSVFHPT